MDHHWSDALVLNYDTKRCLNALSAKVNHHTWSNYDNLLKADFFEHSNLYVAQSVLWTSLRPSKSPPSILQGMPSLTLRVTNTLTTRYPLPPRTSHRMRTSRWTTRTQPPGHQKWPTAQRLPQMMSAIHRGASIPCQSMWIRSQVEFGLTPDHPLR